MPGADFTFDDLRGGARGDSDLLNNFCVAEQTRGLRKRRESRVQGDGGHNLDRLRVSHGDRRPEGPPPQRGLRGPEVPTMQQFSGHILRPAS